LIPFCPHKHEINLQTGNGTPKTPTKYTSIYRKPTLFEIQAEIDEVRKTSELEPANPYTLWLVVFNNPEEYRDGCDGSKFGPHFNEEIQLDVLL